MLALGSCIAAASVLAIGLLALLFRHPNAPRWTRPEIVPMLICVPITVTTGFGLGHVAFGLSRLAKGTGDPRELVVLAAVILVLLLVWRGFRIGERLRRYALATATVPRAYVAAAPTLAADEPPPAPRPQAPRSRRRAA
jgi:heme A synthase